MPGIVGLITKMPRERAEAELQRMVAAIQHESFHETGTWIDERLGVYVGWTALGNPSSSAAPIANERGDVVLFFSGEEFPDPGLDRRLRNSGHGFEAGGPSYLVHAYEEDPDFPANLNGRFHGLLIDYRRDAAILFNDRYAMHRVCYHQSEDAFYFAPEAKAILAVRPELRAADPRSLGEIVACGFVLENRTLFKGIDVLPFASAWVFRGGAIQHKSTYFVPQEWEDQDALDLESYYQEVRNVFSTNLPRYFGGQEQIGMSLTGGLDTRMIMAWQKPQPASLPCFTFGGMYRESQDVRVARQVAIACEQTHEVITVGDEFLAGFPRYAERSVYLTEGGVDVYRASDLYVSEKAREIAPVKIVGTYGSEILQHAVMFKPEMPAEGLFHPELMSQAKVAAATCDKLFRGHPITFAAFRQSPWYHYGILALEQNQLTVRAPYLDNDFVRTAYRAPKANGRSTDVRVRLINEGSPMLGRIGTDRGVRGDAAGFSALAAQKFQELTFKAEYAYDYGMPQWMARFDHLLSPLRLDRIFLGRHKLLHFRVWYRDVLSQYVREMLLDPQTLGRPCFERAGLEAVVRGHLRGDRNYTTAIHRLITVELLHRLFL